MTLTGKRGHGAMASAGATSPAWPCLRILPCPAPPCLALPHPMPGWGCHLPLLPVPTCPSIRHRTLLPPGKLVGLRPGRS